MCAWPEAGEPLSRRRRSRLWRRLMLAEACRVKEAVYFEEQAAFLAVILAWIGDRLAELAAPPKHSVIVRGFEQRLSRALVLGEPVARVAPANVRAERAAAAFRQARVVMKHGVLPVPRHLQEPEMKSSDVRQQFLEQHPQRPFVRRDVMRHQHERGPGGGATLGASPWTIARC